MAVSMQLMVARGQFEADGSGYYEADGSMQLMVRGEWYAYTSHACGEAAAARSRDAVAK